MKTANLDYQKLFDESPLPRLVIAEEKKEHFFVRKANKAAINFFCKNDGHCNIDGMYLADFLDATNKTHILQALAVCYESSVPITIQIVPKTSTGMQVQSFLLSPIKDQQDNVYAVDMQSRPPESDQALIERERDDALSMFTTVFDISDVGITVTDHHGRFIRINNSFQQTTGWTPIDLMGQKLTKIIPPEDHELAWQRHSEALTQTRKNFGEIKILKKDGSVMNVMITSTMMSLSNGRSFRITTIVDVTELKQIERDLRRAKDEADEANLAKSAFLANMSHELRTPLNAIIGFSEMMLSGTLGPVENEHYLDYLGDIKFSAQHLLHIINDVLDMSKIEAGKMPLDEEVINLAGLLDSVRRLLHAKSEENDLKVNILTADNMPQLRGDERLIRQVFLNLLSNAIKFSNKGSEIKINLEHSNGINVSIIDNGIGIPESRLGEVIEPFGQISDPRVNKGQGTGLGLPIAKAMMEMHGGDLTIKSEPDKGTTVTCHCPANRVIATA